MAGGRQERLEAKLVHVDRVNLLRLGVFHKLLERADELVCGAVVVNLAVQNEDAAVRIGDECTVDVVRKRVCLVGGQEFVDRGLHQRLGGVPVECETVVAEAEGAPFADALGGVVGPGAVAFGGGVGEAEPHDELGEDARVLLVHVRAVARDERGGQVLLLARELDAQLLGGILDVFRGGADVHLNGLLELKRRGRHHSVNIDGRRPFEVER